MLQKSSIVLLLAFSACFGGRRDPDSTDLAKEHDDRPLLFATLGGGMVAIEQNSGQVIWTLNDEPAVRVPNENFQQDPQFLPDPRHGTLYVFGTHAGERQILKKLPFTIPQLVANAPCRSSDGILYTGKKIDTWFMIDPKTGIRKHVLGQEKINPFDDPKMNTCPMDPKSAIYLARTEYNILMYDSKYENHKWNVTFFDYSSHNMGKDMLNSYGIVHFTSTSSGRVTSFDRKTGKMLWSHDMESPIVAAYILDRDGLISVPFNAVGDDTLNHIIDDVSSLQGERGFQHSDIELFPSLYIGEHIHGLYALSSLVDKNTVTISSDGPQPLLLEGPNDLNKNDDKSSNINDSPSYKQNINVHYTLKKFGDGEIPSSYFLLGHYSIPDYAETNFRMLSKSSSLSLPIDFIKSDSSSHSQLKLIMGPNGESEEKNWYEIENETNTILEISGSHSDPELVLVMKNMSKLVNLNSSSVGVQTEENSIFLKLIFKKPEILLQICMYIAIVIILVLFWYLRKQIMIFQQLSQSGSRNSNQSYNYNGQIVTVPEELEDGSIKVGKILFNPNQILGKGCDGTFVYRGSFENRDVAVKRLLPECFSFADREVALLTESDTHINVVRYYCMEQDRLFRYIALELCSATLQDYIKNGLQSEYKISSLELLKQATSGLSHLHSLDIVHRDIKPHNVLLSVPSVKSPVRVMISDFGLCKKLNIGRHSFSRRSGVTGTDGWIAPEMLKGERTTTSVDVFSLGCVYYFVLSKGKHPFGDVLERQANILKGNYNLDHLISILPEEEVDLSMCLIKAMLSSNPRNRPTASVVNKYPLFWNKQEILTFLQDVSDLIERDPPGGPLEHGGLHVVRGDWRGKVCPSVAADLRKYRSYSGNSVKDLLRAMRNKKHHYRELTIEAQNSLGSIPENFMLYWLKRFPKLLLHTWLQMQFFKKEVPMKAYYDETYEFNNKYIIENVDPNDIQDYDCDTIADNNLFVKSRNYYDYTNGKKIKFRQGFEKRANRETEHTEESVLEQIKETDRNVLQEVYQSENNYLGKEMKNDKKIIKNKKFNTMEKNRSPTPYPQDNETVENEQFSQVNSKPRKRIKKEDVKVVWNLSNINNPNE